MKQISNYLQIDPEVFDETGVFDAMLDIDANYFINIKRLQETQVDEFRESYNSINQFFTQILKLLKKSDSVNHRFYREAIKKLKVKEVNGIGLGYAKGTHGSGIGKKFSATNCSRCKNDYRSRS